MAPRLTAHNFNISHHHGNCDMCGEKHILVVMFGYNSQKSNCYSLCKNCLCDNIQQILYGFHAYKDGLISEEMLGGQHD